VTELTGIHHVQLAMPAGQEDAARAFYVGVLGLAEQPKPPVLAARGGAWFAAGAVQIHLGVEADFRPARKAHPALLVRDLHAFMQSCADAGIAVKSDDDLPGFRHCYVDDPFGNRLEFLQPVA
jgi:catechol 2,3-dioxygenase-like lactoylglutathione lyase family enzyme